MSLHRHKKLQDANVAWLIFQVLQETPQAEERTNFYALFNHPLNKFCVQILSALQQLCFECFVHLLQGSLSFHFHFIIS
jgi:hypothetical protein